MATLTSSASTTRTATVTVTDWWLKDPTDSSLNTTLTVQAIELSSTERQGVFTPLGRANPVVIADVIEGERGSISVRTTTDAAYNAFSALRATQNTLLLQSPMADQWYVRLGMDRRTRYVFASGNTRVRDVTLTFTEVDAP